MAIVQNPILRGFHPDPSIIRVADDYFIATSTFEWFPGVQIHHSKDLINWKLIGHALTRQTQLDMRGIPDSCGVWAPCLSYSDGVFYLVYSNVKSFQGVWKDTPNFLVTTNDIFGEWSEPTFLSACGFDGSLFHDDDGRKWYTSLQVDHRKNKFFGGIILQEFEAEQMQLIGNSQLIFEGSALGKTEGPHLYKKDGYYYLITAEGGTEYGHAVSIARSKTIEGPYELHPNHPFVSTAQDPDWPLQKTGHGDLVQDQDGLWHLVFLTGRPLRQRGRCTLGRETAIERLSWQKNEWPELEAGGRKPRKELTIDGVLEKSDSLWHDSFDRPSLAKEWQSLRIPVTDSWLRLKDGALHLKGQESLSSFNRQSMLARRIQSFDVEVTTELTFEPSNFQQLAGLVFYYNTCHFHYLHVTATEHGKKTLAILSCDKNSYTEPANPIEISGQDKVLLKGTFIHDTIQFYYRLDNQQWETIGPPLDGGILSDDYVTDAENDYKPAFTGAFVGLCCQDLSGRSLWAKFHEFNYLEK